MQVGVYDAGADTITWSEDTVDLRPALEAINQCADAYARLPPRTQRRLLAAAKRGRP